MELHNNVSVSPLLDAFLDTGTHAHDSTESIPFATTIWISSGEKRKMHRLDMREMVSVHGPAVSTASSTSTAQPPPTDDAHKRASISELALETHGSMQASVQPRMPQDQHRDPRVNAPPAGTRLAVVALVHAGTLILGVDTTTMSRNNSPRLSGDAVLPSPSGSGSPRLESGAPSKAGKSSASRAATHIGSVPDDWPMYSAQASDYTLGPTIGFGASSVVYQASFKPLNGRACAVKVIDLEAFGRDLAELRRETQLMSLSKHPNVLRVRGCWVDGSKLHIATRLMSSGSMLDIMRFSFPEGFEESVIATILKQALEGLNYLHINNWRHR